MTFFPIFLPCMLPKFINKRKRRSLETAMGLVYRDERGMPAPREPCPRVPTTRRARSACTAAVQGSPEITKVQAPRAGRSYPCRWERNTAGRHGDLCQSHSHLSVSFLHCAHMGYTFNWPAAQTHLSLQSRRKKDFIFPLKWPTLLPE